MVRRLSDSRVELPSKRGRGRPIGSSKKKNQKRLRKDCNGADLGESVASIPENDILETESDDSGDTDVDEPLTTIYKPDKKLMDEILNEYSKVKILYDNKVRSDGFDYFHPDTEPQVTKIRVNIKSKILHNIFNGCVTFRNGQGNMIASRPIGYIQDHPRAPSMRYWTHTNINIVGKDEHALSHIPYLGDNEHDDAGFGEELLNTYEEGIHGEKIGCGKMINDWILFYVVDPILKKRGWKEFPDILRLMISLYELFPNKNSARDMASSYADLVQRFDPGNVTTKTRLFNAFGEISSHYPSEVIQSSNTSLVCKRCFIIDCMFHPADFTNTDVHIERADDDVEDPDEPCDLHCYRLPQKRSSSRSPTKRSPRKRLSSNLEVDVPPSADEISWTPHEESLIGLLKAAKVKSSCRIATFLFVFSRNSPKTCKQVYDYMHGKGPFSPMVFDTSRNSEGTCRKLVVAKREHHRTFRSINGGKLNNLKPYQSCNHVGECSVDNNCSCKANKLMCTKYCGCSTKCALRFPGCRCKPGNCRTKQCQCFYASWECDPDLCHECNCQVAEETNLPICRNVCIQRSLQRKLYIGPSEVAGIGCFAEEDIPKGEFIGEYTGEIISQDEAERRGKIYDKFKCSYLFTLNQEQAVDATRVGNIVRFVNHSKHPNCAAKVIVVNGDHHIGLFACHNIKPNQELFFDYSYNKSQLSEFVYKEKRHARSADRNRSDTPDDD